MIGCFIFSSSFFLLRPGLEHSINLKFFTIFKYYCKFGFGKVAVLDVGGAKFVSI